jgi:hypothetical protein
MIIENFSLNSFIKLDNSNRKIRPGLDNSCSISMKSLTASIMFIYIDNMSMFIY